MNAIRIYIVDDEPMAITYLKYLLSQLSIECEIAGEATNSRKGLAEILKLKPDLVFLDINMPVMDGLTLAEEILKRRSIKLFLLTSYRDFDFVKKGMQIGVTDYILKNDLTEDFLQKLLEKTMADLQAERREHYRALEYNVRRYLTDTTESGLESHLYQHKPLQRYALIGVFPSDRIDLRHAGQNTTPSPECDVLRNLPCQPGVECSVFAEIAEREFYGIYFIHKETSDGQEVLKKQAEEVLTFLEPSLGKARCIVSATCKRFEDLPGRYRELHRLKAFLYRTGENRVHLEQELSCVIPEERNEVIDGLRTMLAEHLEEGEEKKSRETLTALLSYCRNSETVWEYAETLRMLFRMLQEHLQKLSARAELLVLPDTVEGPEEAQELFLGYLERVLASGSSLGGEEAFSPYVRKAMEYMRQNYRQDLAMPAVAEAVGVSEGHLRRLFKQELNIKMADYLMEYRIECAKALMKRGNMSVGEVWQQTGFTSAQYFSYVFKKKEGVLPKDFIKGKKG